MAKQFSKSWLIGFLCGALLFVGINYLDYRRLWPCLAATAGHGLCGVGSPLRIFEFRGFGTIEQFHWSNLFLDLAIGLIFSVGLSSAFQWAARLINQRRSKYSAGESERCVMAGSVLNPRTIGFLVGLAIIIVAHIQQFRFMQRVDYGLRIYGIPFVALYSGATFGGETWIDGSNLFADIFASLIFIIGTGAVFAWVAKQIKQRTKTNEL